jgi:seryl-tRNA(Sec) selenium transferase
LRRSDAAIGGGSFAGEGVRSFAVVLTAPDDRTARRLHERLRAGEPAILTRLGEGALHIDLRAVAESELSTLLDRLLAALGGGER